MSTRNFNNKNGAGNIPEDLDIPACTIEDVDRSLFNLFDKQLPFTYKHKKGTKKAPVIVRKPMKNIAIIIKFLAVNFISYYS